MRRLGSLMESLLTLTRSDGRNAVVRGQRISVNDAVVAAAQQGSALAQQRGVRLALELCGDEQEPTVLADRELLTAMVSNLLRNAIRFAPAGQAVEVTVRQRLHEGAARVAIEVADRGPGIDPAAMTRVFDRFVHGVAAGGADAGGGGAGLGLAIARSVAELHGGGIRVADRPGGGCVFTVELPLIVADPAPQASASIPGTTGMKRVSSLL
jgi:signal transduction histidine kinase